MAEIRNSLSMKLKGRAGAYSFYSSKGRQIARVAQNSSNYGESARRSLAQQTRRVKWANLVNFFRKSKVCLKGAFTTKRSNETDYNAFMRKNLPAARVALTKDQAALGMFVPDAFQLSEGEFASISTGWKTIEGSDYFQTRFTVDGLQIDANTTVKQLSESLLADNLDLKEGMQLTLLTAFLDEGSTPVISQVQYAELTLSTTDTRKLTNVWSLGTLTSEGDYNLGITGLSTDTWAAWILSDSTTGQLRVSTEYLMPGDEDQPLDYSLDEIVLAAAESYGLDPDIFLASGDYNP